jgi:hypothetical protein
MKNINKFIIEKLKLTKGINSKMPLDKVFNDIYELVDALNRYFDDSLKNPIKVIKSEVVFRPDGPYGNSGVYVKEHFIIEFKKTGTRIRFGYRQKDYGLVMQFIYENLTRSGGKKYSYGDMRKFDGYKFGKDNFLQWLLNPENEKLKRVIIDYFNLKEE